MANSELHLHRAQAMTRFLNLYEELISISVQAIGVDPNPLASGQLQYHYLMPGSNPVRWYELENLLSDTQGEAILAFPNYNDFYYRVAKLSAPEAWRASLKKYDVFKPSVICDELRKAISIANARALEAEIEEKQDKRNRRSLGGIMHRIRPDIQKIKDGALEDIGRRVVAGVILLLILIVVMIMRHWVL